MSGTGSRFINKGYKNIKPLIKVFNKPIIEYIVEKFSQEDNFIFVCREEHLSNKKINLENYLNQLPIKKSIICVENHKLGPVHSLIKIAKYLNNDSELIVNYCDFDWRWQYESFKEWLSIEKPIAALCVYSGFHPHYINPAPYAHVRNHQHNVLEIREKQSFTKYREEEPAASGTFYFSSGKILLDACKWLIEKDERINDEFYVSLLFNYFPMRGLRTLIYQINNFMQWGTPEDLEEYCFYAKKVPLKFPEIKLNCPSIVLMAGKGSRMKSIDKIKKPYLEIDSFKLFELCTKNLQTNKKNIYSLTGDDEDKKHIELFNDSYPVFVGETNSSVETLIKSLSCSDLSDEDNLMVMPCDSAINFDWDEFFDFNKSKVNCNAIIFSFSRYPYAKWKPNQFGWLKINQDNSVKSIGYKKGWESDFSNPIITGYFWFPNIGRLKKQLINFLNNSNNNHELSIDEFCEFLINKDGIVYAFNVKDFLCLGTADEFRLYEYWLNANKISKLN